MSLIPNPLEIAYDAAANAVAQQTGKTPFYITYEIKRKEKTVDGYLWFIEGPEGGRIFAAMVKLRRGRFGRWQVESCIAKAME